MLRIRKSIDSIKTSKAGRQKIERVNFKCVELYTIWPLIKIVDFQHIIYDYRNEYKLLLIFIIRCLLNMKERVGSTPVYKFPMILITTIKLLTALTINYNFM